MAEIDNYEIRMTFSNVLFDKLVWYFLLNTWNYLINTFRKDIRIKNKETYYSLCANSNKSSTIRNSFSQMPPGAVNSA